jgi:hypothetical protein
MAFIACAACASGRSPVPTPAPVTFTLSSGCLPTTNSNGVWLFGYTVGQVLAPSAFRKDGFYDGKSPLGFWQPSSTRLGHFPYVVCNSSAKAEVYGEVSTPRGWVVRPGQVAMEASKVGQYSVVRFTAPVAGSYRVTARFEGIHFGLSTTDVHVWHGSTPLFGADIDGYGGDPAFRPAAAGCDTTARGANPVATYEGMVKLVAGDTIDFAVGYGQNRTHFCDTTGLSARLEVVAPGEGHR